MWAFQMFSAWVTAPFQLVEPSGNVPAPPPSARCMVMLPLFHFEPSVEKPRAGSEEMATRARTMTKPSA